MNRNVKQEIASNLRYYRKLNNYTQRELANALGISHNTVSAWESGTNSIDVEILVNICGLFNITLNDMLKTEDNFQKEKEPEPKIEIVAAYGGGLNDGKQADELRKEIITTLMAANIDTRQLRELLGIIKLFDKTI